jgi:hypothetical protein
MVYGVTQLDWPNAAGHASVIVLTGVEFDGCGDVRVGTTLVGVVLPPPRIPDGLHAASRRHMTAMIATTWTFEGASTRGDAGLPYLDVDIN